MTFLIRAAILGLAFAAAPAAAELTHYRGLCDASAAVALGPEHFVVADDESNILTLYRRGQSEATATLDLTTYLGRAGGKAREADLEGAARIGDRIYWIASHGRNSKGKLQETRRQLFATDLVTTAAGPSLKAATTAPYLKLIEDLVADPRFAAVATASAQAIAAEAAGGLNIEGLAATPAGELLIGFRNPLPQGKALLLRLKNPAAVIERAAPPVFGDPILLDLGGRAIRSIDHVGRVFLIVAGPFDGGKESGKGFALYTWSGEAADVPQRRRDVDFGKLRPEALFAFPDRQEIYLLSDDGDEEVDGRNCKDKKVPASKKSFRGVALRFPGP
ncbi:MAG: DUF3616 domain-containing protein [Candidatus Accumulibacter sp. UW20]